MSVAFNLRCPVGVVFSVQCPDGVVWIDYPGTNGETDAREWAARADSCCGCEEKGHVAVTRRIPEWEPLPADSVAREPEQ